MTSQTLPGNPDYTSCPAYGPDDVSQEIRLVIDGMAGYIPTATASIASRVNVGATKLEAVAHSTLFTSSLVVPSRWQRPVR